MYEEGQGVEKDIAQAHILYEKAAENGHAESMYRLALVHEKDYDLPLFPSLYWQWILKAAEGGHPESQYRMARKFVESRESPSQASFWYRKAAAQGHTAAVSAVSIFPEARFARVLQMAESGDANAKYFVGRRYLKGDGVEANVKESIKWLGSACEGNIRDAQYLLGTLAEQETEGLTLEDAFRLYKAAYEHGEDDWLQPKLALKLGQFYIQGKGVEKNNIIAAGYLRNAPLNNAYYSLARVLDEEGIEGESRDENQKEAFALYYILRDRGIYASRDYRGYDMKETRDADYRLGQMYEEGRGTAQDDYKAAQHYKVAAKHGHVQAQEALARLHAVGRGLTIVEKISAGCSIM